MFFLCVTHVAETELNEKKADQIQEEGAHRNPQKVFQNVALLSGIELPSMMAVKIIVFNPKGAEESLAGLKKWVFQRKKCPIRFPHAY